MRHRDAPGRSGDPGRSFGLIVLLPGVELDTRSCATAFRADTRKGAMSHRSMGERREGAGGLPMFRRHLFVTVLVFATLLRVPPAFGWVNGGSSGNGYGTHDWVLDEAVRLAGPDGTWVDLQAALQASDDPDTDGETKARHGYYDTGLMQGGPQSVADAYYQAVVAYRAGDIPLASICLGRLSHYYSDVLEPFHTNSRALRRNVLHADYERVVGILTDSPGENRDWIVPRVGAPFTNIRAKAVSAALYSRVRFPALVASVTASATFDINDPIARSITAQVLSRAANDLADVVRSLPSGMGTSPAPSSIKAGVSQRYPTPRTKVCALATCLDASGAPIRAAAVVFSWPGTSGRTSETRYTDSHGVARDWHRIAKSAAGRGVAVVAVARSSGASVTASTWYAPRVVLAPGRRGVKASVSNKQPEHSTTVTARVCVRDSKGRPIEGLQVKFIWTFSTGTLTGTGVTDASGVARMTQNIGEAAPGVRVRVSARIVAACRTSSASLVPK